MFMSLRRAIIIVILALVLIIVVIGGHTAYKIITMTKKFAHMGPPPPTVSVAKVEPKSWQPTLSAVGTLQAVNGVNVSAEVPGTITKILFQSGQIVKNNQPLIQLDDSTDQQNLRSAIAQLQLKQVSFEQQTKLLQEHATSRIALDQAKAALASAEADVANAKHAIRLKLITAPFEGKIGIRKVNIGQYVTPGQALVSLQSMDPLYVQFYLPEQDLSAVKVGQAISAGVDTYKGEQFPGTITAINSQVDEQTRNIELQATIRNKDMRLYPGIFANVSVQLAQHQKVLVVPETAVTYSLYGDSVYVVDKNAKSKTGYTVHERFISVGLRQGKEVAVLKGLKAGDQVVTSGQLKLHDNDNIQINNKVQV